MSSSVSISPRDLLNCIVINQVDRKFILITVPISNATIIALVDQHAADERYRLEVIIQTLSKGIHRIDPPIVFRLSKRNLQTLSNRRSKLMIWGVEIEIIDDSVQLVGIPWVTANVIEERKWKMILFQFATAVQDGCPSVLMSMLCSKACRSVSPSFSECDSRRSCSMTSFQKMTAWG